MNEKTFLFEDNAEYDAFVEKFTPKKTTDDCYTPPLVYDAIRGWACNEYGIAPDSIVRPFYPGGDYERYEYSDGCVVLDNPPFSIISKIISFYNSRDIKFFYLLLHLPFCLRFAMGIAELRLVHQLHTKTVLKFPHRLQQTLKAMWQGQAQNYTKS